ncbi:hypothetical protein TrVFT333_006287 [Trichoderma virens FT-333]|nr:hypothetical protein TrVFT333_006287 [Trichoderma virens FT-333]
MAPRRIDIDPDGDTLIILPTIKAEVNGELAKNQEMIEADTDEATETSQVISSFKVSMKHLTLASPRAKKVLQGCFMEFECQLLGNAKSLRRAIPAAFHMFGIQVEREVLFNITYGNHGIYR